MIRVFIVSGVAVFFRVRENIVVASCTLYSSLIIVKFLQLRGRRQIAEPRKFCLVRVIVFFDVCFLYFFFFLFLTGWEFGLIHYTRGQFNFILKLKVVFKFYPKIILVMRLRL